MNGEPVELTYVEFELLSTLASRPGRVYSRQALLVALWGDSAYRDPRTIDVHVRHLREKLEPDAERAAVHPDGARRRLPLPRRVNPLRSVGARLSLALLLVRDRRAGARLRGRRAVAREPAHQLAFERPRAERAGTRPAARRATPIKPADFFERAATTTNARVVLLRPLSRSAVDSERRAGFTGRRARRLGDDPLALDTSHDLTLVARRSTRDGERFAEVAVPVGRDGSVLLLSASLARALGDVSLVKRRLLIAGGVVLALVFVVGYAGAWVFARRIRRLEQAAERIADGMFDEPVVDSGQDEVGELARAFERMRRRLAQLDHARREFIANASHELRTPVFSLGGFLELLDDEELDEETRREFLTTMREQVQRLEKLATELLDLSRLDAGHIDLDRDAVAVDEVARTAAGEFAAVALQSGHDLEVDAAAARAGHR